MRRKFLGRRPLVVARVRAAPHRDLAVAVRLLREPFDDVVTVARFLDQRPELALRVAAAAHVHGQERIAVRGEVHAAIVVALRDVRRQREHARRRRLLLPRRVHGRVQFHAVAQRDLHAPLELDLRGIRRRRCIGERIACEEAAQQSRDDRFHVVALGAGSEHTVSRLRSYNGCVTGRPSEPRTSAARVSRPRATVAACVGSAARLRNSNGSVSRS